MKNIIVCDNEIRVDEDGLVCITDVFNNYWRWGYSSYSPWHWKTSNRGKEAIKSYKTERGQTENGHDGELIKTSRKGTFVHPILAIDYAAWLTRNDDSNLESALSDAIDEAGLLENFSVEVTDLPHDLVIAEGFGEEAEEAEDYSVHPLPEDGKFRFDPSDLIEVALGALSEHMTAPYRAKLIHDLIAVGTGFHVPVTIIADETIH